LLNRLEGNLHTESTYKVVICIMVHRTCHFCATQLQRSRIGANSWMDSVMDSVPFSVADVSQFQYNRFAEYHNIYLHLYIYSVYSSKWQSTSYKAVTENTTATIIQRDVQWYQNIQRTILIVINDRGGKGGLLEFRWFVSIRVATAADYFSYTEFTNDSIIFNTPNSCSLICFSEIICCTIFAIITDVTCIIFDSWILSISRISDILKSNGLCFVALLYFTSRWYRLLMLVIVILFFLALVWF